MSAKEFPGAGKKTPVAATEPTASPSSRLVSLDAYRGFVMLFMASEGLELHRVAKQFPDSPTWQAIGRQFDHVAWLGCSFWDLIQPSFMFMVGVAMAFSCAARLAKGQSYGQMFWHALGRSAILILLGVFLRSLGQRQTYWTFEDVVTQIGLGYTILFLMWGRRTIVQVASIAAILAGYWLYFYSYPLPPEHFDYSSVGVPADWPHLTGRSQHWDKNTNAAHYFDVWFLNLFPRESTFRFNEGGYLTLSFIPSLATMALGLLAGELLRSRRGPGFKIGVLAVAGAVGLAAGSGLEFADICPVVKRIWTPSWTLFAAGCTAWMLAGFYAVIDVWQWRTWAFPLVVVGMNSTVMYAMHWLADPFFRDRLLVHIGSRPFELWGWAPWLQPFLLSLSSLALMWSICYWLYRRRVFVRI